jgi:predicted esterase
MRIDAARPEYSTRMNVLSIPAGTHGRVLVEGPPHAPAGVLVACHGYGQSADDILEELRCVDGIARWRVVAVQGLHRFYSKGDRRVVASWMTTQDRELAIADNLAYVDRAIEAGAAADDLSRLPLVFCGFSQGAAMAYRAALLGRHRAAGILVLGGDVPPDIKTAPDPSEWPPVLVASGAGDRFYTPEKLAADVAFLRERGVAHEAVSFDGGHEWTAAFREAAADWLGRVAAGH